MKDYKFQEGHTSPTVSYWADSAEISHYRKAKSIFFQNEDFIINSDAQSPHARASETVILVICSHLDHLVSW